MPTAARTFVLTSFLSDGVLCVNLVCLFALNFWPLLRLEKSVGEDLGDV